MTQQRFQTHNQIDLDDVDLAAEHPPVVEPMTEARVKAVADELGKLSEMLGNDDTAEVLAQVVNLLDNLGPDELSNLFAGFTRLAIVPEVKL